RYLWLGDGPPRPPQRIERHQRQRHPDQPEAYLPRPPEGLVEQQHRRQQLERRRQVLQEAERRHRQLPRRLAEAEQWPRRRDATQQQQQIDVPPQLPQRALAGRHTPQQQRRRRRRQQERLDAQPQQRLDGRHLAEQPVGGERARQRQRDPREAVAPRDQVRHPARRQQQRQPLHEGRPLAEEGDAEQDVQQRVDEVAEAG